VTIGGFITTVTSSDLLDSSKQNNVFLHFNLQRTITK